MRSESGGPTTYPFKYHSWPKIRRIPSLKLCIPLTAVESLSFKYGLIAKPEHFLDFSQPQNPSVAL